MAWGNVYLGLRNIELDKAELMFYHLFFKFIYFERERGGGRQKERRRERIPRRLCAVSAEPNSGLDPTTLGS